MPISDSFPDIPQGARPSYLVRGLASLLDIPRRAFQASEEYRQGGGYDPGPILEAALLPMGGTLAGAPAGAVGAGPAGRRLGKPDFDRILTKQRAKDAATMPRTGPEINRMPAVIDAKGNTYEGFMHADAIKAAQAAGAQPADWYWPRGYVTNKGRFVLRPSDDAWPNWLTELLKQR